MRKGEEKIIANTNNAEPRTEKDVVWREYFTQYVTTRTPFGSPVSVEHNEKNTPLLVKRTADAQRRTKLNCTEWAVAILAYPYT